MRGETRWLISSFVSFSSLLGKTFLLRLQIMARRRSEGKGSLTILCACCGQEHFVWIASYPGIRSCTISAVLVCDSAQISDSSDESAILKFDCAVARETSNFVKICQTHQKQNRSFSFSPWSKLWRPLFSESKLCRLFFSNQPPSILQLPDSLFSNCSALFFPITRFSLFLFSQFSLPFS